MTFDFDLTAFRYGSPHNLFSLPDIVKVCKSRMMRSASQVAYVAEFLRERDHVVDLGMGGG